MRSFAVVIAAVSLTGSLVVAGCGTGGIHGPGLDSVKVTITSPTSAQTIQTGQTVNITASVTNAKFEQGVVWSISGGGSGGTLSNPSLTSVTYNAPTVLAANTTFIVTATSVANPSASASFPITVTTNPPNSNNALLSGQYAFLVSGGNSALAASITADGSGTITGGEEDAVAPSTGLSGAGVAITSGSYAVGSDDRGVLTYTDANSNSFTFTFVLGRTVGGVATQGQMIEADANPAEMTGSLALQSPAAFTLSPVPQLYAFGFPGWDASDAPMATAGSFVLVGIPDGACMGGSILGGEYDQNDSGTLNTDAQMIGGPSNPTPPALPVCQGGLSSSVDSNGRATLAITDAAGTASTYSIYIVSPSMWFAVGPGNGGVSSGEIRQEFGSPYSASSLDGNAIFVSQSDTSVPSPNAALGIMTFDGTSSDAYSLDQDAGGGADVPVSGTTTYNITDPDFGRFTISGVGVGYLYGPDQAFIVGETATPSQVGFATLEPQVSIPYSNSSMQGTFFVGTLPVVGPFSPAVNGAAPPPLIYSSGVLTLDGAGNVAGTLDATASGLFTSGTALTDTYSVAANGRATTGSGDEVIYIVSPAKFYYLTIPSGSAGDPTIGVGYGQLPPP